MKPIIGLLLAAAAFPQTPYDKVTEWFAYNADHGISKKWSLHLDAGWRETNESPWSQWLVRPGVNYQFNQQFQFSAAYSYFSTYPLGLSVARAATPEHRLQEQVQYTQAAGRVTIRHRVRLDHRFLGSATRPHSDRDWNTQHRYRYMLRAEIPIRRFADDRNLLYAAAYNEVFFRTGFAGTSNFDQNRLYGGLGLQTRAGIGLEFGVFNQRFQPMAGGRLENNYVFVTALRNTVPLKRLFRR